MVGGSLLDGVFFTEFSRRSCDCFPIGDIVCSGPLNLMQFEKTSYTSMTDWTMVSESLDCV